MADAEVERAVAARTYRRIAAQLDIEAALLRAQSEAFADAATRIEEGAEVDTLRLGDEPDAEVQEDEEPISARREGAMLRAVVAASRMPVSRIEEASFLRLAEEAGFERGEEDDAMATLRALRDQGFVEQYRDVTPERMILFVATVAGFEEVDAEPPGTYSNRTVWHEVVQPTREMAAVEPRGFELFRRTHGEPVSTWDAWLGYELSDAMKALIDVLPGEVIKSPHLITVLNEMADAGQPINAVAGSTIVAQVRHNEELSIAAGDR